MVNQERLKPQEDRNQEERSKVEDLRGSPMSVGTLEEIVDDDQSVFLTPLHINRPLRPASYSVRLYPLPPALTATSPLCPS